MLNIDNPTVLKDETFVVLGKQYRSRGKSELKRVYGDKQLRPFPVKGMLANSDRFRNMKYDLYTKAEAITFREKGVYSGGHTALSDWTQPASMTQCALNDNRVLRRDKGLLKISENMKKVFRQFAKQVIDAGDIKMVTLKNSSRSGYPDYVTGKDYKISLIENAFKYGDVLNKMFTDEMLNSEKRFELLYRQFRMVPCFTQGFRVQSERIIVDNGIVRSKERKYPNKDYIISNGKRGTLEIPSYYVIDERGKRDERFLGGKLRTIYMQNYVYTFFSQISGKKIYSGMRNLMDAFKYNGPETIINNYEQGDFFIASDISNFGETHPGELTSLIWPLLREAGFSAEYVNLLREDFYAPSIIRTIYKNENDPFITRGFHQQPTGYETTKSGNGHISAVNNLHAGFMILIIANLLNIRLRRPEKYNEFLNRVLHGEDFTEEDVKSIVAFGISALNNEKEWLGEWHISGDDIIFKTSNEIAKQQYGSIFKDFPLYDVSIEDVPIFLGYYYYSNGKFGKDLSKLIESTTCFERDYTSKPFHAVGIYFKMDAYRSNPLFAEVMKVIRQAYVEHYDFDIYKYGIDEIEKWQHLTHVEKEFLANPDVIMYKYDPEQVRDELREVFYKSYNNETITEHLKDLGFIN